MAVTKRKLSYYNIKTIEELKALPNSYFPAIQTEIANYKVPATSFFNTFPTKNEVYNTFPTKTEMYNAISDLGGNSVVWIYDNGHAYSDTINALTNKKLPIYVYESSSSGTSGSGTSATPTGLAYDKEVNNSGVSFYSLLDTNAEFTEYFVKNDNTVESTECKNIDACIIVDYNDPAVHTKVSEAISYGQAVICKSANNYMNLAKVQNDKYSFRYDSNDSHGYWNLKGNDYTEDWTFVEDQPQNNIINKTIEGTVDTQQGQETFNFDSPLDFAFGTITLRVSTQANGHPSVDILNDTTTVKTFETTVTCFNQSPNTDFCNIIIPVTGRVTGIRIMYGSYIVDDSQIKITAEGISNGSTTLDNQVLYGDQPLEYDNQPIIFDT